MGDRRCSTLLSKLGVVVLAFNSVLAVYRSWGDAASVAFVLAADVALLLLFLCLGEVERAQQDMAAGAGRNDISNKAAVWVLTTLLTGMFASRVAALVSPAVAAVVWAIAAATSAAGFWAFFLH
ncbi:hypothetical protein HU200_035816 [Digitaria exilis]|uniref:Uncharacterized protein n=1 Tax=Digitaria exilis TaxID=1010633 RepID=A0A835EP86_9POAL|nr:hypothetical protein HU200_035816 [Digitaria exilis]CAB3466977.1 unnamed protein product [Digitaria exilis]